MKNQDDFEYLLYLLIDKQKDKKSAEYNKYNGYPANILDVPAKNQTSPAALTAFKGVLSNLVLLFPFDTYRNDVLARPDVNDNDLTELFEHDLKSASIATRKLRGMRKAYVSTKKLRSFIEANIHRAIETETKTGYQSFVPVPVLEFLEYTVLR